MNYATESRNIFIKGVRKNKNIHPADKEILIEVIARQFTIMSQYIGTTELLSLRNKPTTTTQSTKPNE